MADSLRGAPPATYINNKAMDVVMVVVVGGAGRQVQQMTTTQRRLSQVEAVGAEVIEEGVSIDNHIMDHAMVHRQSTTKATNGAMIVVMIVTIPTDAGGVSPTSSNQQELLTGTGSHRKMHVRLPTTTR